MVTIAAVTAALGLTGYLSARVGEAPIRPAVVRNVVGGLLAMGVTYGIGSLDRRRRRLSAPDRA